jgi:hypothetical protein
MSRVGLLNLAWGFFMIFMAACGGAFVALRTAENFISGTLAPQWEAVLQASSHGHTALFGVIHILLGLTIPYARSSIRHDQLKSLGILAGSFAMGPLLLIRASLGPTLSTELNGVMVGVALSMALLGILFHAIGLLRRVSLRG